MSNFDTWQNEVTEMVPVSDEIREQILRDWDARIKPPGSLGKLEALAAKTGSIQLSRQPRADKLSLRLFVGSHGIAAEGVSLAPSSVNISMLKNFREGGAAINALCRSNRIDFEPIDAGVHRPTQNFKYGPAMSQEEVGAAMKLGWYSVPTGTDLFAVGEMGIGNTASASAILSVILKAPVEKVTGRGTGLNEEQLARKVQIIRESLHHRQATEKAPLALLGEYGGREIAAMTGAILSAASKNIPVVLDGVIALAAAAVAFEIDVRVKDKCIAAHRGTEPAIPLVLKHYDLDALLDLDLRLGEGSGAALAMGLLRSAVDCLNQMFTFEQAGMVFP